MTETASARPATYHGLGTVAGWYPGRDGKKTSPSTPWRHIKRGVDLADGTKLKLAAKRFPGGWAVCRDDFDEFIAILTADRSGQPAPVVPRTPSRRAREIARADAALEAMGF